MRGERSGKWGRAVLALATLLTSYRSPLTAMQIQDNSFLLEEAYNQEAGVVQHINTFSRSSAGAWAYSFTQEWPLGGIHHQLSYTIPLQHADADGTGFGDVALNYRYQLVGSSAARKLIAPRFTVLLPTGNEGVGRGSGGVGLQVNLPFTWVVSPTFTAHGNAGATLVPSASLGGPHATTLSQNLGASLIWALESKVNVLVESVWLSQETPIAEGTTVRDNVTFINPGVRAAFDFANGLQIVPGLAYTIALSGDAEDSLFLYLSIEHPFKRQ